MTPDQVRSWVRVIREIVLLGLAVYMLIYAVQHSAQLQLSALVALITAGLGAAGLPVALRWDQIFGSPPSPPSGGQP